MFTHAYNAEVTLHHHYMIACEASASLDCFVAGIVYVTLVMQILLRFTCPKALQQAKHVCHKVCRYVNLNLMIRRRPIVRLCFIGAQSGAAPSGVVNLRSGRVSKLTERFSLYRANSTGSKQVAVIEDECENMSPGEQDLSDVVAALCGLGQSQNMKHLGDC